MAFDLSNARPVDESSPTRPSGTRGFNLSTARPIDDSDVTSNVPEQKIETTMLGSAAASGAEAALAMPAVLVETGFLSNPEDEDYLNSEAGQKEICEVITKSLIRYKFSLENQQKNNVK